MLDHQIVVDDIRSFLQSADQSITDQVKSQAARYAELCQEVNQRLRRCEEFLKKGLRGEAVHQAQIEPKLLEVVDMLDFPERTHWEDVATLYGLTPPPRLNMETAGAVRQAAAEAQPLENLLRSHRLLAVGCGPLPDRLRVLRRLAEIDAGNPVWAEDVQTFERARLRQLDSEAEEAIRKKDIATLTKLQEETCGARWLIAPSPALLKRIGSAAQQGLQAQARQQLRQLAGQLHEAFSSRDQAQGKRLRTEWDTLAPQAGVKQGDALWEQVAPALDWLTQEEQQAAADRAYQTDLDRLRQTLRGTLTRPKLEQAVQAAQRHSRGLPVDLDLQCRARHERLVKAERIQKLLIAGGIAFVCLIAIGTVVVLIRQGSHTSQVDEALARVEKKLADDGPDAAIDYLELLGRERPDLAQAPELQEVRSRANTAKKREQQEKQNFETALKEEDAERADKLARTADEKARVETLRKRLTERNSKSKEERQQDLQKRLARIEERVLQLERNPESDESVTTDLAQLDREARDVSTSIQDEAKELKKRYDKMQQSLASSKKQRQFEQDLDKAVPVSDGAAAGYRDLLQRHTKEFADTPRSRDFDRVLKEEKRWLAALEWHRLMQGSTDKPLDLTPRDARSRVEQCRKLVAENPEFADAKTVQDYLPYLDALAQRDEADKESAAARLERLLAGPPDTKNWWRFTTKKEGKTYYTTDNLEAKVAKAKADKDDSVSVNYLLDLEGNTNKKRLYFEEDTHGRAPQHDLAEVWGKSSSKPWNDRVIDLAVKIRDAQRIDPIPQFTLLQRALENGSRGSHALSLALQKHREHLTEAAKFDQTVPWMDPDNMNVKAPRQQAEAAIRELRNLPSFDEVLKDAARRQQDLEKLINRTVVSPVGWLAKDAKGGWQCRHEGSALPRGGLTLCVVTGPETGTSTWQTIGQMSGGQPTINGGSSAALVEGRLVFARKP